MTGGYNWPAVRGMALARGLEFRLGADFALVLHGPREAAGPALLAMLAEFRAEAEHEAALRWRRRVRRLDTGATVDRWEPAAGPTDWDRLRRAADALPGVELALETYAQLGEGGVWTWRTFGRLTGGG